MPKAVEKYSLLKELDDKGGEKQELEQKNRTNEYTKSSLGYEIRKLESKKENIEAEKNVFNAQIGYAQVNIKNLKEEYNGYYSRDEIKEYETKIASTKTKIKDNNDEIEKLEKLKTQKEQELAEVIKKQKIYYNQFQKIDAELDKIMEKVEKFYKENYPEQLW